MEQNETPSKSPAGNTNAQNDRRTFLIAFLTTVILLALYHFGTGLFAIFAGKSDFCTIPVAREYVLVPVSSMPEPGMGMMGRGHGRGFHRGEHGEGHGFGRRGEGMHRHGRDHGPRPDAPASPENADQPEPAAEQPAKAE